MKVELKAYGRKGSLLPMAEGVGQAKLTAETKAEARALSLIVNGDLWAKARLLFAMRVGLTDDEKAAMTPLLDRTYDAWVRYIEDGVDPLKASR